MSLGLPSAHAGVLMTWWGIGVGTLLFAWAMRRAVTSVEQAPSTSDFAVAEPRLAGTWLAVLLLALIVGAAVRLWGLDIKGLSHPEAYIPGIDLPAGISEPPPRHHFRETLVWHFTAEPHPFGYYLAMWGWTKLFGTSLVALRLPEAIAGIVSIAAIYRVAALSYGKRTGVLAAAMLSLHGFHVFWSQAARMYAPGAMLGLLSTWALLEFHRPGRHRGAVAVAYAAATVAGLATVEFFWPFLATQMLWVALNYRGPRGSISRTAYLQASTFVLAAPLLSSALMTGRGGAASPPTLEFLRRYFSFGFVFQHGAYSEPTDPVPLAVAVVVFVVSLLLVVRGARVLRPAPVVDGSIERMALLPLLLSALAIGIGMFGIGRWYEGFRPPLEILSGLPMVVVLFPIIAGLLGPSLARIQWPRGDGARFTVPLVPLFAVFPTLILFLLSFKVELLAPRAFLLFVPFLLILAAAGIATAARHRVLAVGLSGGVLAAFTASVVISRRTPISPRDYQLAARQVIARMQPQDMIFVPARSWYITPLFYYLDSTRVVARDFADRVARSPRSRVWIFDMQTEQPPEIVQALSTYKAVDSVWVREMGATLLEPPRH